MIWYEEQKFDRSNLGYFYGRLMVAVRRLGMKIRTLGFTHECPIYLVCSPKQKSRQMLLAAGFHGEEQAGPWALLRYLEIVPLDVLSRAGISFLPMVNPTGFRKGRRLNDDGDSPNTGFIPSSPEEHLSIEGKILVEHKDLLVKMAQNGFLSLHEQTHTPDFYTYVLENREKPSATTMAIRDAGGRFFPIVEDGIIPPPGGGVSVDGIVSNEHDGTFEDMLFHEGVPCCYTTETPIKAAMAERIRANLAVIHAFGGMLST